MKISITALFAFLGLSLAACGGTTESPVAAPAPGPTTTTPEAPPPPPAARTMGTARAMGTSPDNLLYDPTYGTLNAEYGAAIYQQDVKLEVEFPTTSPAGVAAPVLVTTATTEGGGVYLMGQGGVGPFEARVYVSVPEGTKPPHLSVASFTDQSEFELSAVDGSDVKHGDRVYRLYAARIDGSVLGHVAMLVEPSSTQPIVLAAPEIRTPAKMQTRGISSGAVAKAEPMGPAARRAMRLVLSRPIAPGPARPAELRLGGARKLGIVR
jgi:hypothetical protein